MDKFAYIYKITSPSQRIYIGSTINLNSRKSKYRHLRCQAQTKLYNSLKKYGFNNHKFEIVHICDAESRNQYEFIYGKLFDVLGEDGLNLCLPKYDETYKTMSDETRKKIGEASKNKIITENQKAILSQKNKEYWSKYEHPRKNKASWNKGKEFLKGELNPMYGVRRSDEWKAKNSALLKERAARGENHKSSKIVVNLDNGIFNFSIKEAAEMYNYNYSTLKSMLNGSAYNKTVLKLTQQ